MAETRTGKTKVKHAVADTQVGLAEIPLSRLDRVMVREIRQWGDQWIKRMSGGWPLVGSREVVGDSARAP